MIIKAIAFLLILIVANLIVAYCASIIIFQSLVVYLVVKHRVPDEAIDKFMATVQYSLLNSDYLKNVKRKYKPKVRLPLFGFLIPYVVIWVSPYIYLTLAGLIVWHLDSFILGVTGASINLAGLYLTYRRARKILIYKKELRP